MVVAIIGILSGIAYPVYNSYREKIRIAACILAIGVIADDIKLYYEANGEYPDSLADIGQADAKDPWGNPYQYLKIEGATKNQRQ